MSPARLKLLVSLPEREVYVVAGSAPAVYLLRDRDAGGVLVNTPPFDADLAAEISQGMPLRYLFFPSRFGAQEVAQWRTATGAETIASAGESPAVGAVDIVIEGRRKLTRTLDLLPMSGRTVGSCALHARNLPGLLFLGPILAPLASGWPGLQAHADDHSLENRLLGTLALRDLRFDYVFTDEFTEGRTRIGPGAAEGVARELDALWL